MSKLSRNYYEKVRKDIRTRYLAGESVPAIAKHYEINARTVYYYLKDVTPEEKGLHIKNNYLQKLEKQPHGHKEKGKKNRKKGSKKRTTASEIRGYAGIKVGYDFGEPGTDHTAIYGIPIKTDKRLKPGEVRIVRPAGATLDPNEFVTDEPDSSSDASTTEASLADFIG